MQIGESSLARPSSKRSLISHQIIHRVTRHMADAAQPAARKKFAEASKKNQSPTSRDATPGMSQAEAKKARAQEYDKKRIEKAKMASGEMPKPEVKIVDAEIYITTGRLLMREDVDVGSTAKGFINKGELVAIRKRAELPMLPPIERLQIAKPSEVKILGWIDAVSKTTGEPNVVLAPPEGAEEAAAAPPAFAPAADAAAVVADKSSAARPPPPTSAGEVAVTVEHEAKQQGLFASFWAKGQSTVLRNVFFREKVDKSDAGLAKRFAAVDRDGSGSISADEMKEYILSVYGNNANQAATVRAMMMAADTNGDNEIDLDEFKAFMRSMPDTIANVDPFASFWAKGQSAVLRHVFFREKVDKSDAGLAKRFAAVDKDGSGKVSADEMQQYILSVYGNNTNQTATVKAIMKAADTNKDGEIDLEEFKSFMRAMPDTKKRSGPRE